MVYFENNFYLRIILITLKLALFISNLLNNDDVFLDIFKIYDLLIIDISKDGIFLKLTIR